jgi:hypothetical protein
MDSLQSQKVFQPLKEVVWPGKEENHPKIGEVTRPVPQCVTADHP